MAATTREMVWLKCFLREFCFTSQMHVFTYCDCQWLSLLWGALHFASTSNTMRLTNASSKTKVLRGGSRDETARSSISHGFLSKIILNLPI